MRVGGKTIKLTEKVVLFMPTEISTTATGKMIKPMATESIVTWTAPAMKDIGKKTSSMVMVLRPGLMVQVIKVTMLKERNMERANSHGLMEALIKESSTRTISKDMASINGLMEEYTKVSGRTTKWKVTVSSCGPTAESTRVSTWMIKRKEEVYSIGQMEGNTRETGKMENNTVSEFTHPHLGRPKKDSGVRERE
jgi:hypothetical protein